MHASDFDLTLAKQHIGTYKSNSTHLFSIDNNIFVSTILIRDNIKSFCGFQLFNYCYYFRDFVIRINIRMRPQSLLPNGFADKLPEILLTLRVVVVIVVVTSR